MTATMARTFPAYHDVVQELVEEHLEIEDQPLLLALYYASEQEPEDIFLFEVANKFGGNRVSEDSELMEVTFGAGTGLQIDNDQRLHLTLTNPREFETAIQKRWQGLQEVVHAVTSGRYQTVHAAPEAGRTCSMPSETRLPSGRVWLRQALSDLECGALLETKPDLRCHAIAKYQQALEKSVKALAVAVSDNTAVQIKIRFDHGVETYINVLQRVPLTPTTNAPQRIRSLFNSRDTILLYNLIAQAPGRPAFGETFARNTEYPFQNAEGEWTAPADTDVYSVDELKTWGRLTTKTALEIERLVGILYRSKRGS